MQQQRNILSANDLSKDDILAIFDRADHLRKRVDLPVIIPNTQIGGLLFFQPSTRTRIGLEVAFWKLGIKPVGVYQTKLERTMVKAESLSDTIRTLNAYVDYYCIRHPESRIFDQVLPYTDKPVINCGNGHDEHPLQALIDAYAIWTYLKRLDDIRVTIVGAPRYSRAAHSFLLLLAKFKNITIYEFAPDDLRMQEAYKNIFIANNNQYIHLAKPKWGKEQVVYSTGFAPKNPSGTFSQTIRNNYKITVKIAQKLGNNCIILNPLPRIDEIDYEVDALPVAYYFEQNALALYVRMAVFQHFYL